MPDAHSNDSFFCPPCRLIAWLEDNGARRGGKKQLCKTQAPEEKVKDWTNNYFALCDLHEFEKVWLGLLTYCELVAVV